MPWIFFSPLVVAYVLFEMQQQREFEFDQQRWDGESPAYLKE